MNLTCEINPRQESIEIIFDHDGLKYLKKLLNDFDLDEGKGKIDHKHLMTKEWGGSELTSEIMNEGNTLVNHLKLVYLKD